MLPLARIPNARAMFQGDFEQALKRRVPPDNEACRLLVKYLEILREETALMSPELLHLAAGHVHDLIATALATQGDGAAMAIGHSVRAARLKAVKTDILEHVGSPQLTVAAVAHRQHVTRRYIHMLFETEGITFSQFVLSQRLMRARRMLFDPGLAGMSVTAIAFAAGFGDLSYFNRTFRRCFGMAPSELRRNLRRGEGTLPAGSSACRRMPRSNHLRSHIQ